LIAIVTHTYTEYLLFKFTASPC